MSLRWRLLLISLGTLALGLGVLLVAGNLLLSRGVSGSTIRLLRTRLHSQRASLTVSPNGMISYHVPNDELLDYRAWVLNGTKVIERPTQAGDALDRFAIALGRRRRPALAQGPQDVQLLSALVYVPHSHRIAGAVVVGVSLAPFDQLERNVLVGSVAIAALILAAGAFAIQRALLGALGPVRRMTVDAEEWGAHDLDRRFDLGPPKDELTGLAMTLDHLLERIASSRRHEQRFAADVAHELRTPLSAIRGRAELALDSRQQPSEAVLLDALEAIKAKSETMTVTVETLLAVARSEIDAVSKTVDLRAVVTEFEGVEIRADGAGQFAEGDPEIVRQALAPLIDNARRHARSAVVVELESRDGIARVTVRDDGEGLDPELGEAAFEPGRRGAGEAAGGAGLGLALARRLARVCGGDVSACGGPGGCFVLELPAIEQDARQ
ncbi:MAG: sensor histidine kinase [Solirubrobacteraceae bacterium]